jgi:Reverse transcriptase (RNA-dependent DNA polymerase)
MGSGCKQCLPRSYHKEKVYFVVGGEFGHLAGHTLVVEKALYGLHSSGLRWHKMFADILRGIGFNQCKADSDIWMRKKHDLYEYIAVYADDLAIAAINPEEIITTLKSKHGLNLKSVDPLKFHLRCDFQRDEDGTLSFGPKKYIEKMLDNYERMFGEKPRNYSSPLGKNDHPELDCTDLLVGEDISTYS